MNRTETETGTKAGDRQANKGDKPGEVTVLLPDDPPPLPECAAAALLRFIRDEHNRHTHHSPT